MPVRLNLYQITTSPRNFSIVCRLIKSTTTCNTISAYPRPYLSIRRQSMATAVPLEPQRLDAPLTSSATFLVLKVSTESSAISNVRSTLAGVSDIIKNVAFRDLNASFACTVGIGSSIWDQLTNNAPRPAELHPFKEMKGKTHTAVSTPGDILFHIRSERRDLNFEFERQLMDSFDGAVTVVDETVGFRYFDVRDLLGFVDGTANPVGQAATQSIFNTKAGSAEDGGSYVVVQKYLHDIKSWRKLSTEKQEAIIGRTKLDNIELDDADAGTQQAHKSLATVEDENGVEHDIVRDNMPFGSPGTNEFGTYFIGYSKDLWVIEKMLQRMFVGEPEGLHDRILDYSKAVTGSTFFAPTASFLESLDS